MSTRPFIFNSTLTPSPMKPRKKRLGKRAKKRESVKVEEKKEVPPRVKRQRVKKRLDIFVSILVRRLYGPLCFTCKEREATENGHLFSRRYHATRWDWQPAGNCMPSCSPCNLAHQSHKDPYVMRFVCEYGSEAFAALRDRAFSGQKFTLIDLEEMLKEVKFQLRAKR